MWFEGSLNICTKLSFVSFFNIIYLKIANIYKHQKLLFNIINDLHISIMSLLYLPAYFERRIIESSSLRRLKSNKAKKIDHNTYRIVSMTHTRSFSLENTVYVDKSKHKLRHKTITIDENSKTLRHEKWRQNQFWIFIAEF